MELIISTILAYVAIWVPSLVAVLGIAATVILAIAKVRTAANELKNADTIAELTAEIARLREECAANTRTNKILIDQIANIKGYADRRE